MAHPPKSLQPFLWSTDTKLLDLEKDKDYIIHQILLYGRMQELQWLFQTYSKRVIVEIFIDQPIKMYPKFMYEFIKTYILSLDSVDLDEDKYVTSISGPVRQRAAGSV